uniref:Uncharacterized protein n=1 Tax=Arundo donax TaxID=35708 RepID=A0A0A8Y576_ARUDO
MYWTIFMNTRSIAFPSLRDLYGEVILQLGNNRLIPATLYVCHIMPACSWHYLTNKITKYGESTY